MSREELKGVGGWLAWLVFGLIFVTPLLVFTNVHKDISQTEISYPAVIGTQLWANYKMAQWSVGTLQAAISVFAAIGLWFYHVPRSVSVAKISLWVAGPVIAIVANIIVPRLTSGAPLSDEYIAQAVGVVLSSSVSAIVWTLYLMRSRRVANTYGLPVTIRSNEGAPEGSGVLRKLWSSPPLKSEGLRRVCLVLNVVGLLWCVAWLVGCLTTLGSNSRGALFLLLIGIIGYAITRTTTWVIAGFAMKQA